METTPRSACHVKTRVTIVLIALGLLAVAGYFYTSTEPFPSLFIDESEAKSLSKPFEVSNDYHAGKPPSNSDHGLNSLPSLLTPSPSLSTPSSGLSTPSSQGGNTSNEPTTLENEGRCFLYQGDAVYRGDSPATAYMLITQKVMPRAYHMGIESFLKHHPNVTLKIYTGLNMTLIDPRWKNFTNLKFIPMGVEELIAFLTDELTQALPYTRKDIFESPTWLDILAHKRAAPMILSDYARNVLLYLYGGSFMDIDCIYLRPLVIADQTQERIYTAVTCYKQANVFCTDQRLSAVRPGDVPKTHFGCTNGFYNFPARHPFLKAMVLDMVNSTKACGGCAIEMGGQSINRVLSSGKLSNEEWPRPYDLIRLFGFAGMGFGHAHKTEYQDRFNNSVPLMLKDLEARKVHLVQIYSIVYKDPKLMREFFAPGSLFETLWKKNCIFSCDEPVVTE